MPDDAGTRKCANYARKGTNFCNTHKDDEAANAYIVCQVVPKKIQQLPGVAKGDNYLTEENEFQKGRDILRSPTRVKLFSNKLEAIETAAAWRVILGANNITALDVSKLNKEVLAERS